MPVLMSVCVCVVAVHTVHPHAYLGCAYAAFRVLNIRDRLDHRFLQRDDHAVIFLSF